MYFNYYKRWSQDERNKIFNFVKFYGIPINEEGKPNWSDLKTRFMKEYNLN